MQGTRGTPIHLSNALFAIGVCLLLINGLGFFRQASVDPPPGDHSRTVSEEQFWQQSHRRPGEGTGRYVSRLNALVHDRFIHTDPANTKPTFFENYLLWAWAQYLGYYEWTDAKRAVRVGGGFCSQQAMVLNDILWNNGIPSRIVGLDGHVVNEALVDGAWRVYDPDYGIVFGASLKRLEEVPVEVYEAYRKAGIPHPLARRLQEIFASDADNWQFMTTAQYATTSYLLERASYLAIWALPGGLFLLAWAIRLLARHRRPESS